MAGRSRDNKQTIGSMGWLKSLLLGEKDLGVEDILQDPKPSTNAMRSNDGACEVHRDREEISAGQLLQKEFGFHDSCELSHIRMHNGTPTGRYTERKKITASHEGSDLTWESLRQQELSHHEREERRRMLCQASKWDHLQTDITQPCQNEQLRKDSAKSNPIVVTPLCKDFGLTGEFPLAQRETLCKSHLSREQARLANDLSSCLKGIKTDVATLTRELSELLDSK